jgi:ferredoxin
VEPRVVKVVVDLALCVGHARCEAVAGAVYRTDDAGNVTPVEGVVPRDLESVALRGARACPERAISILGGAEDREVLWPPPRG